MQEFEEQGDLRESLKTEVTETYGLINNLFQTVGFFAKIFFETIANFASYFSGNKENDTNQ